MYFYEPKGPGLFAVRTPGLTDPESEHKTQKAAAARVSYLNGERDLLKALERLKSEEAGLDKLLLLLARVQRTRKLQRSYTRSGKSPEIRHAARAAERELDALIDKIINPELFE